MTTGQNADRIRAQIDELRAFNKPLEIAVRTVEAQKVVRIFQNGLTTAGQSFAYNSTNELYASDDQLPRGGTHKGKHGKAIKSSFYQSYKQLRQQQGRESNFVNWRLSGDLQSDYANANVKGSAIAVPNPVVLDPNNIIVALRRQNNVDKRNGLEKKYGTIFDTSPSELQLLNKVIEFELFKAAS